MGISTSRNAAEVVVGCFDAAVEDMVLEHVNVAGFDALFEPGKALLKDVVNARKELHRAAREFRALSKVPGQDQSMHACIEKMHELRKELELSCDVERDDKDHMMTVSIEYRDPGLVEEQLRSLQALCQAMTRMQTISGRVTADCVELSARTQETRDTSISMLKAAMLSPLELDKALRRISRNAKTLKRIPPIVAQSVAECQKTTNELKTSIDQMYQGGVRRGVRRQAAIDNTANGNGTGTATGKDEIAILAASAAGIGVSKRSRLSKTEDDTVSNELWNLTQLPITRDQKTDTSDQSAAGVFQRESDAGLSPSRVPRDDDSEDIADSLPLASRSRVRMAPSVLSLPLSESDSPQLSPIARIAEVEVRRHNSLAV